MERAPATAGLPRAERLALLGLIAFAAAVRWIQWSRAVTLFNDGPEYLLVAKAAAAGDWAAVIAHPYHPLYSLLVAAVHALGCEWETAGALVGVAGGSAAVGLLFLFVRDAFGAPAAWIAAGLLAVQSRAVEYSSDIQSDGLYLGLFLAGVWFGWRGWTRRSLRDATLAGVASGLAYLTRPEGLGLAFVLVALAGFGWLRGRSAAASALRFATCVAAAAFACAAPYVIALHGDTGTWALTHKKSMSQLAGPPVPGVDSAPLAHAGTAPTLHASLPPAVSAARLQLDRGDEGLAVVKSGSPSRRAFAAARMLWRTSKSSFRYGTLVLLAIGLFAARGRPGERARLVGAIALAYELVLYGLTLSLGYVSRRHTLPPLVPLFGYAGLGAIAVGTWIADLAPRRGSAGLARVGPAWIGAVIAALVGLGELITQVEPRRADERAARAAAEWLRDHAEPGPLATSRLRLGYYAGMPYVPMLRVEAGSTASPSETDVAEYFDEVGVRYVLTDDPEEVAMIRRALGAHLRTLHSVQEGEREAWVFERVDTPTAAIPPP